jgi:hypothetical protein
VFRDHRQLPWLRHVAMGPGHSATGNRPPEHPRPWCWRSATQPFLRYRLPLGGHLLWQGCLYTRVESRLLPRVPSLAKELAGFRNKVFRSDTLTEADISNLYTEIVALDLFPVAPRPCNPKTRRLADVTVFCPKGGTAVSFDDFRRLGIREVRMVGRRRARPIRSSHQHHHRLVLERVRGSSPVAVDVREALFQGGGVDGAAPLPPSSGAGLPRTDRRAIARLANRRADLCAL